MFTIHYLNVYVPLWTSTACDADGRLTGPGVLRDAATLIEGLNNPAAAGPHLARVLALWSDALAPSPGPGGRLTPEQAEAGRRAFEAAATAIAADTAHRACDDRLRGHAATPYFTREDAERDLGLTRRGIYALVQAGRLRRLPGLGRYRFTRESLDAFLAQPRKPRGRSRVAGGHHKVRAA